MRNPRLQQMATILLLHRPSFDSSLLLASMRAMAASMSSQLPTSRPWASSQFTKRFALSSLPFVWGVLAPQGSILKPILPAKANALSTPCLFPPESIVTSADTLSVSHSGGTPPSL